MKLSLRARWALVLAPMVLLLVAAVAWLALVLTAREMAEGGSIAPVLLGLGAVIGTGGMSDVYAATDELLGRDVAVKMMRADLARDETFLERFRREAKNAAKLNHHAIVAVYDTGEAETPTGPLPYIVMEYVDGETLRDVLRRDGTIRDTVMYSITDREWPEVKARLEASFN